MPSYPALRNPNTNEIHSIDHSVSFLVGRNETANVFVNDPTCSRHHFRIQKEDKIYYVEPLSPKNPTYYDGKPIEGRQPLKHGTFLQAGRTLFQFLLRPIGNATPMPSTPIPQPAGSSESSSFSQMSLREVSIIARDQPQVNVYLPHPQVSRQHASLTLRVDGATLTDLHSANGTFVNGQRIQGETRIQPGDRVDIGPFALQFTGTALIPRPRTDNVELIAQNITRVVRNRETGEPLKLLDDITLVIKPREFVCLLGPSGSGKSTLMKSLSGREAMSNGAVLLNNQDLFANFANLKQDIALVPQKDVLHDSLRVEQALRYTAKLRLPPDTSSSEVETALEDMLSTVGLTARRAVGIRHLSGGQVKRASLANEILCKPTLLFLDEVTSGLDEQTDREVMDLFRSLADAGKTVVCITHSLANVDRACHLVVILTAGGKLAFVGKPAEALLYFGIERLGDVYERLEEKPAEFWQQKFQESKHWHRYVVERLPKNTVQPQQAGNKASLRPLDWFNSYCRQSYLLTSRYLAIWWGDYRSLIVMIIQALVVACLLGLLFGNLEDYLDDDDRDIREYSRRTINLMFLLAVTSFWFGCNNSAKEIVKERVIYERERDFNLLITSYYTSKLIVLTLFSWTQTIILFFVVYYWCALPGETLGELGILLGLALTGVTIGLAISTYSSTEEMAITLIPMAVIPQIILSGTICPLEDLSKKLAEFAISTHWGKRGLDACLEDTDVAGLDEQSLAKSFLILAVHAILGIIVALGLLKWQSRRR